MAAWEVQPGGVQGVLGATEGVVGELGDQVTAMTVGLEGAAGQASSPLVAGALAGFADAQSGHTEFVFTRAGACIGAATQATSAYVAGDEQMAATAQANAAAAPDPRATMPRSGW